VTTLSLITVYGHILAARLKNDMCIHSSVIQLITACVNPVTKPSGKHSFQFDQHFSTVCLNLSQCNSKRLSNEWRNVSQSLRDHLQISLKHIPTQFLSFNRKQSNINMYTSWLLIITMPPCVRLALLFLSSPNC